jgi:hypothetical protein
MKDDYHLSYNSGITSLCNKAYPARYRVIGSLFSLNDKRHHMRNKLCVKCIQRLLCEVKICMQNNKSK